MERALIFGITGQDGAYLASYLLKKNYAVFGTSRKFSQQNNVRLKKMGIISDIQKIKVDLSMPSTIRNAINIAKPHEIYNLASVSSVVEPFKNPILTSKVNGLGVVYILEEIQKKFPNTKFFQASSSQMYGSQHGTMTEDTIFRPTTPYAISKVFSHYMTIQYRRNFNIFACCGILFNHESPLRGLNFVTRKITNSLVKIKLGKLKKFQLGNINARRDWGFAGDYVKAMWLMLQNKVPDDFVISSGKSHSIEDFLSITSQLCNLEDWRKYVEIDDLLKRKIDYHDKIGNSNKAKRILKWKPKMTFQNLVKLMVKNEINELTSSGKINKKYLQNF